MLEPTSTTSNRSRHRRLWLLPRLSLTAEQRRAAELRWRDGLSPAAIAQAMGISEADAVELLESFERARSEWYRDWRRRRFSPKNWSQYQKTKMKGLDALGLSDRERQVAAAILIERADLDEAARMTGLSPAILADVAESIEAKQRVAKEEKSRIERYNRKAVDPALNTRGQVVRIKPRGRSKRKAAL